MKLLKTIGFLPLSYLDSFCSKNKDLFFRYQRAQLWSTKLLLSLNYSLEVINPIQANETYFLVCNHQSTFDPLMIVASYPNPLTFISKIENKKIPIINRWANNLEIIYFDRQSREGNISMLRQATNKLKQNQSVLIFPEGTRSKSKTLSLLKAGALQPAKLANKPICVVTLINSYEFDIKHKGHDVMKIVYGPILDASIFKEKSYEEIIEVITQQMQHNLDFYR